MTPRLVAFSGPAGAGKSTASKVLTGEGFVLVKFAGPLKAMLRAYYCECGLDELAIERRIEGDLKEESDPFLAHKSPRHAMLTLGTEWGRDMIGADVWLEAWASRVKLELAAGRSVVCDDLRFPNEEQVLRDLDGMVVEIEGRDPGHVSKHRSATYRPRPHATIYNQHTEADFIERVRLFFFRGLS